jgi:NitT/TauT family transport system substrate-binding protein
VESIGSARGFGPIVGDRAADTLAAKQDCMFDLLGRWKALAALVASLASAQGAEELRLGYFPNITHGQALYARATGEFEKAIGGPIKWTAFNAGPTAIESLFVNAIDATYIGPGPTVNGYIKSRGAEFVIVAGAAIGGAGMVVRRDSGIVSEKDFNGKVIATPQLGNTQDIAARTWFSEHGYRFREKGGRLTIVPLSNPDQLTMFKKKQIDGAWTVEPWLSRLELEAGAKIFLEEKSLWPQGKYVTTHLVVSRAFLQRNPDVVKKLIAAHVAVTKKLNADRAEAARILNAQLKVETGKGLKDETMKRALDRVQFTWDPVPASLYKSAEEAHRIGYIRKQPKLDGIYALNFLNEALKQEDLPVIAVK